METENSGAPCPDNLRFDDSERREGDMETEDNDTPCLDDSIPQSIQAHLFKRTRKLTK